MSATFKLAKKKFNQNDLRRMMNDQKGKIKQPTQLDRINSPLAKYNDLDQITCVLCKSIVRSESVWKVHINSKLHRENIAAAKQLKEQLETSRRVFKRPAEKDPFKSEIAEKREKLSDKTLIETATNPPMIPKDFFDVKNQNNYFKITLGKTSIKADLVNIKRDTGKEKYAGGIQINDVDAGDEKEFLLPEGFFDDPVKDAKIRNQEYKDPFDDEWDKFQKEIKEESTVSNAIIAEEQDEATTKRQIEEIDDQICKWNRVLNLERRKENVSKYKSRFSNRLEANDSESSDSDISDDSNEFLDWRSKMSVRKVR